MPKVVYEFQAGKYTVLKLDRAITAKNYSKYIIKGKQYDIVPVYDMKNCIAIQCSDSFLGESVGVE